MMEYVWGRPERRIDGNLDQVRLNPLTKDEISLTAAELQQVKWLANA
jgi:hypothetical protein